MLVFSESTAWKVIHTFSLSYGGGSFPRAQELVGGLSTSSLGTSETPPGEYPSTVVHKG